MAVRSPAAAAARPEAHDVLTDEALAFVQALHREFDPTRHALLRRRRERRRALQEGFRFDYPEVTRGVRDGAWQVPPPPADLRDRRVEITGPAEPKMMINALNSGANVFMADLEDALAPTWSNVLEGQRALAAAARGTLRHEDAASGRRYALGDDPATLVMRPRGWHLDEKNVSLDGRRVSASLFDAGLFLFHAAPALLERGSGPYLYLPKLESHLEARLWNAVLAYAEEALGLPHASIRTTVLVETVQAALEMEEILFELRERATGLNAGRWDYIFSLVKAFADHPGAVLPDRGAVTMTVPFMRAYSDRLVRVCHRRGAHALGGMAANVPDRRDEAATERALAKVAEDKRREAEAGFDGTWIAHPGLQATARREFDAVLGAAPHQIARRDAGRDAPAAELTDLAVPDAGVTEAGVRTNVRVALRYFTAWFGGRGAVAIDGLMEDAATAEISRAQLWQWLRHGTVMDDGRPVTREACARLIEEQAASLEGPHAATAVEHLHALLDERRLSPFATARAYEHLP